MPCSVAWDLVFKKVDALSRRLTRLEVSKGLIFIGYRNLSCDADTFENAGISGGSVESSGIHPAMIGLWPLLN